jgi:hypothetical protein
MKAASIAKKQEEAIAQKTFRETAKRGVFSGIGALSSR